MLINQIDLGGFYSLISFLCIYFSKLANYLRFIITQPLLLRFPHFHVYLYLDIYSAFLLSGTTIHLTFQLSFTVLPFTDCIFKSYRLTFLAFSFYSWIQLLLGSILQYKHLCTSITIKSLHLFLLIYQFSLFYFLKKHFSILLDQDFLRTHCQLTFITFTIFKTFLCKLLSNKNIRSY
jgi:hypothetical protein